MTSLPPIERAHKTLSAQAHERIRDAIIQQALPPGQRLDQTKLADDLQVSLVPVREALRLVRVPARFRIRALSVREHRIGARDVGELHGQHPPVAAICR